MEIFTTLKLEVKLFSTRLKTKAIFWKLKLKLKLYSDCYD